MGISTPVLASIIGAIVGGAISGVINIISLSIQYKMNKKHREDERQREWIRETARTLRALKQSVIQFDPSTDSDESEIINSQIETLEDQKRTIPSSLNREELESVLSDITLAHQRKQINVYDSNHEYRAQLIQEIEDGIEKVDELRN